MVVLKDERVEPRSALNGLLLRLIRLFLVHCSPSPAQHHAIRLAASVPAAGPRVNWREGPYVPPSRGVISAKLREHIRNKRIAP